MKIQVHVCVWGWGGRGGSCWSPAESQMSPFVSVPVTDDIIFLPELSCKPTHPTQISQIHAGFWRLFRRRWEPRYKILLYSKLWHRIWTRTWRELQYRRHHFVFWAAPTLLQKRKKQNKDCCWEKTASVRQPSDTATASFLNISVLHSHRAGLLLFYLSLLAE